MKARPGRGALRLCFWLLLLPGCATTGQNQTDTPAVLGGSRFDEWFAHIVPAEQERWYGRHDWLPDVGAGLYAAVRHQRPLLLWIMSGNPLHCDCAHELEGLRSVWSDPMVEQFTAEYVQAVDTVWELLTREDLESLWVRELLCGSPKSGVYLLSPSGEFLARCHTLEVDPLLETLGLGLERWEELDAAGRGLAREPPGLLEHRFERKFQKNGLVLTRFARELPLDEDPRGGRSQIVGWDQVWISPAERRGLVPRQPREGERFRMPASLLRRLARLHFLDDLRGPVRPFSDAEVEWADGEGRVKRRTGDQLELEYSGRTRARARDPESGEFGVETSFVGRALYDSNRSRFVRFRLVALGSRFGRASTNARVGQEAPTPVGYALRLTAPTPLRHAPPRHARQYADAGYAPATANAGAGR